MRALKPIRGNRIVTVEEALRRVESMPDFSVVDFRGEPILKTEYDALQNIAQTYFGKSAEEFFSNTKYDSFHVYLNIYSQNVKRMKISNRDLPHIPKEIGKFVLLESLHLNNNKRIEKIENVDNLTNLRGLNLMDNPIDYSLPHNKRELEKLIARGVYVINESS